uniref:GTPase IMAP family member 8-like isoform X2 n=1 Tax=Scatophagus argus TaxID=75038 RepID=UPI001ED802F6|nr:GTPase IMAP family member 8-like isoform X2 [Scatophagus argus]
MHSIRPPPRLTSTVRKGGREHEWGGYAQHDHGLESNPGQGAYPDQLTVALFGKRVLLKNIIGNMILCDGNYFVKESNSFVVEKNNSFKIINTPNFFDEECLHPDQQIIDFMALSYPGPDLFILAIDSDNTQEETVVAQISKLQHIFGENITAHLVVTLPNIESFHSLGHLKDQFKTRLATANENLSSDCKKWCLGHRSFLYDYKNYSKDVVIRRRTVLEKRRSIDYPLYHHGGSDADTTSPLHTFSAPAGAGLQQDARHHIGSSANGVPENTFNIVLLGLTGTGKSASANTILIAGNPELDPRQLFKSQPSSLPITTQCEVKMTEKPFGVPVRVVDTPDFFHDELNNSEQQINECKKYLQQGQCVVLLVLQLGRFTDYEQGILERLEDKFGWRIRDSTIVLLTHGEDLKGDLDQFIKASAPLKNLVELCHHRHHLFNNSSRDSKQVINLIKKIPDYKNIFPKFMKRSGTQCCVC